VKLVISPIMDQGIRGAGGRDNKPKRSINKRWTGEKRGGRRKKKSVQAASLYIKRERGKALKQ